MTVLAIGAHFDDIEIGCGGTLAKHLADGESVIGLVVSTSDYTNYKGELLRDKESARHEGEAAASIIGYQLIAGPLETKKISFGTELIEMINQVIDENQVSMVYTHWDLDVHSDHQAIAKSTLAAARNVNRILLYQSNLYPNTVTFRKDVFVDISDHIDTKVAALKAHKTEYEKFGEGWLEFWKNETRNNGQRVGVQYAESFQLVKYLL